MGCQFRLQDFDDHRDSPLPDAWQLYYSHIYIYLFIYGNKCLNDNTFFFLRGCVDNVTGFNTMSQTFIRDIVLRPVMFVFVSFSVESWRGLSLCDLWPMSCPLRTELFSSARRPKAETLHWKLPAVKGRRVLNKLKQNSRYSS